MQIKKLQKEFQSDKINNEHFFNYHRMIVW